MTPSVAPGDVPTPMMPPPGMTPEYANPSAGPRGRGLASGVVNGPAVMVPTGMRSPVPGVSPVGPGVPGGMGVVGMGAVGYAPVGVVGAPTGPPVMGVGGPVRFAAAPPEVSTVLPSTFAVGKSGDPDDADSLVLRRRRYVADEEAVGGSSGVEGEVTGATNSGRLPRSPAMQVLQSSIIA